jgi:hypothetical protein
MHGAGGNCSGRRILIVVGKIVQCQFTEISVWLRIDDRLVAITLVQCALSTFITEFLRI